MHDHWEWAVYITTRRAKEIQVDYYVCVKCQRSLYKTRKVAAKVDDPTGIIPNVNQNHAGSTAGPVGKAFPGSRAEWELPTSRLSYNERFPKEFR